MPDKLKSQIKILQQAREDFSIAKERLRLTAMDVIKASGLDFLAPKDFDRVIDMAENILKDKLYEEIRNHTIDFYKKST